MRVYGLIGRAVGLIVFLAGVVMLVVVFWQSWQMFLQTGLESVGKETASGVILARLSSLIARLALLLAMCVAGSLIASKGIQLYSAGESPWPGRSRGGKGTPGGNESA